MKKSASLKLNRVLSAVLFALGIAVLAVFILFATAPDAIAPYNPKLSFDTFLEPSAEHILGTNNLGYDILSELIHASRTTLTVGLLSALVCTFIGTIAGVVAGCAKGLTGEILNGFINFFIIIPMLPLAIVIGAYLSGGALDTVLTISLIGWCGTARAVKAKTEKVKNSPYVRLMRGLGFSRMRILFRHVLPNVLDVAAARYITSVASCILLESTLGFLGVGAAGSMSWGVMINYAYKFGGLARGAYNWLLAPGVCIMLLELAFHFISRFIEDRLSAVRDGRSKKASGGAIGADGYAVAGENSKG